MQPAIAQICSLPWPLERDVEDYAAAACGAIELWLGKVDAYLATHSLDDLRRLLDQHRLLAPVASFQGGLWTRDAAARNEHASSFDKHLQWCAQLGVGTLDVAGDIAGPFDRADLDRVRTALAQAADEAAEHGVRLALEFQARAAFATNLLTAAALVAEVGSANLGLCLDAFHYFAGPSKPEDLTLLTPANLFHVQLCDVAGVPREWAADGDRILPGEGDIGLDAIVARLREIDYPGAVSVELMNPQLWHVPPRQFGEIAITALRIILGLATME